MSAEALPEHVTSRLIVAPSGHWVWVGSLDRDGYGQTSRHVPGRSRRAHKFVYETLVGPIGEGLVIDHLCGIRRCVNPMHMQPVTQTVNVARGASGWNHRKMVACKRGHPLVRGKRQRFCPTCRRDYVRLRGAA